MWLFGYGSLMWDGWETEYGCLQREHAIAPGHFRVFNKKSLERWGTYDRPGLTLNLAPLPEGHPPCLGIAFQFPNARQTEIEDYLSVRETCAATEIPVQMRNEAIMARTYIYDGPRLIKDHLTLEDRARMVLAAEGIAGSSYAYIKNVRAHLEALEVADHAVEELWGAVTARKEAYRTGRTG